MSARSLDLRYDNAKEINDLSVLSDSGGLPISESFPFLPIVFRRFPTVVLSIPSLSAIACCVKQRTSCIALKF